jgi:hypothetical protein
VEPSTKDVGWERMSAEEDEPAPPEVPVKDDEGQSEPEGESGAPLPE